MPCDHFDTSVSSSTQTWHGARSSAAVILPSRSSQHNFEPSDLKPVGPPVPSAPAAQGRSHQADAPVRPCKGPQDLASVGGLGSGRAGTARCSPASTHLNPDNREAADPSRLGFRAACESSEPRSATPRRVFG
ncbi:hypothetical protein ACCO45_010739 [Purpureocillium lilacinum]|uniref:Uncharacterized protein n=1 Tax=Purpureocillium lilacinum TaxID=33203 RepID=A0ACC4DG02_PURLI